MRILTIILITLIICGCSAQTEERKVVSRSVADKTPEETLASQVSDGKIVNLYQDYVRLKPGEEAYNWIIIRNAKESSEKFTIYPCSGCTFETDTLTIASGEYKILRFSVKAESGEKQIKVKDSLNNAYGYAKMNVIIE